jgi:hypothetical protein
VKTSLNKPRINALACFTFENIAVIQITFKQSYPYCKKKTLHIHQGNQMINDALGKTYYLF